MVPSSNHHAVSLYQLHPRAAGPGYCRLEARSPSFAALHHPKTLLHRSAATCASASGDPRRRLMVSGCADLCVSGWSVQHRLLSRVASSAIALLKFLVHGAIVCFGGRLRLDDGARSGDYCDARGPCPGKCEYIASSINHVSS